MAEGLYGATFSIDGSVLRLKRAFAESCGFAFDTCIADWMRKPQSALGMSPADYLKKNGERGERRLLQII